MSELSCSDCNIQLKLADNCIYHLHEDSVDIFSFHNYIDVALHKNTELEEQAYYILYNTL